MCILFFSFCVCFCSMLLLFILLSCSSVLSLFFFFSPPPPSLKGKRDLWVNLLLTGVDVSPLSSFELFWFSDCILFFFLFFLFFYCKSYFLCFATASTRTWSSLIFILFFFGVSYPTLPTLLPSYLTYPLPTYSTFALTSLHYPLRTSHPPRNPHILFTLRNSFYIAYTPPDVFVAIYALPGPLLYAHPTLTHTVTDKSIAPL